LIHWMMRNWGKWENSQMVWWTLPSWWKVSPSIHTCSPLFSLSCSPHTALHECPLFNHGLCCNEQPKPDKKKSTRNCASLFRVEALYNVLLYLVWYWLIHIQNYTCRNMHRRAWYRCWENEGKLSPAVYRKLQLQIVPSTVTYKPEKYAIVCRVWNGLYISPNSTKTALQHTA
jgi:hypothetical protein